MAQREWQRDKARHLFQLLLAQRNRWVQRDRLTETLWPELPPEAAARDFKVALNSLNRALEPLHAPDLPFAYVEREGSVYRLRPSADLWLDASAFEQRCDDGLAALASDGGEAGISILQDAIRLYCGDYLPDSLYEDWALEERERLLTLYLRASDSLAVALLERARFDEALGVCDAILSCDPCWERAYRHAMLAHDFLGNHSQACRIYQRCVDTLKNNLEVEPSSQTRELFERIRRM